jgi:ABC-type xylose transport system permease subunit
MIAKLAESFFIVVLAIGIMAMIYPSHRVDFSLGTLWFLCGAAVCYVWL